MVLLKEWFAVGTELGRSCGGMGAAEAAAAGPPTSTSCTSDLVLDFANREGEALGAFGPWDAAADTAAPVALWMMVLLTPMELAM